MSTATKQREPEPETQPGPGPSRSMVERQRAEAISAGIVRMAPQLEQALPGHISVQRFTRVALVAVQTNPALLEVDRQSLFNELLKIATQGLLPDGNEAALVVFRHKTKGKVAKAMPMIAGILKKIRQSGEVAKCSAQVVYANDEFIHSFGYEENVRHIPPALGKPRGKPIGVYATAVLRDGSQELEVMDVAEVEKVRAVSRSKDDGPWIQWWSEMARKTVLRRLAKRLPTSTDVDEVFRRDETLALSDKASVAALDVGDDSGPELSTAAGDPPHSDAGGDQSRLDALEQEISDEQRSTAGRTDADDNAVEGSNDTSGEAANPDDLPEDRSNLAAWLSRDEADQDADFEPADDDPGEDGSPAFVEAAQRVQNAELLCDVDAYKRAAKPQLNDHEAARLDAIGERRKAELRERRGR